MAKKFSYYTNKRLEQFSGDDPFRGIPYKQKDKLCEMIAELSYMLLQERIQRKELIDSIKNDMKHIDKKADYYYIGLTH